MAWCETGTSRSCWVQRSRTLPTQSHTICRLNARARQLLYLYSCSVPCVHVCSSIYYKAVVSRFQSEHLSFYLKIQSDLCWPVWHREKACRLCTKQVYTKFKKKLFWCKIKHEAVRQSTCQAGMRVSMEGKQREKELLLQLFPKSSLIPI